MKNLPYDRADRLGNQIYQLISSYIYENIDDERLKGVQLTGTRLTKDFSIAHVYFYVEGGKEKQDKCLEGLEDIKGRLRHYVGSEISIRIVPKLIFCLDEGIKNAERIHEIFDEMNKR